MASVMSASAVSIDLHDLPDYEPSEPPPSPPMYRIHPSQSEERLDSSAQSGVHIHPNGTFSSSTRDGHVVLCLTDQEVGATEPVYGRSALIAGFASLVDLDLRTLKSVDVKVQGEVRLTIAEGGTVRNVFHMSEKSLWKRPSPQCPEVLPFDFRLPAVWKDNRGVERPLPPSFHASYDGVPGLYAKVKYTVTLTVKGGRNIIGLPKTRTITIPFIYRPKTRPPRPSLISDLSFFGTSKSAPEEWHQVDSKMSSRDPNVLPIECHLVIPSVQVYSLKSTIPFHLQLQGSIDSFKYLNPPTTVPSGPQQQHQSAADCPTPSDCPSTKSTTRRRSLFRRHPFKLPSRSPSSSSSSASSLSSSSSSTSSRPSPPPRPPRQPMSRIAPPRPNATVRVYLMRQIEIGIGGQRAWRTWIMAEGKLSPVSISSTTTTTGHDRESPAEEDREMTVAWDGEMTINPDFVVGSFRTGGLWVKDYVVLSVMPPWAHQNPLLAHQNAVPIRLVTDTFDDYQPPPI